MESDSRPAKRPRQDGGPPAGSDDATGPAGDGQDPGEARMDVTPSPPPSAPAAAATAGAPSPAPAPAHSPSQEGLVAAQPDSGTQPGALSCADPDASATSGAGATAATATQDAADDAEVAAIALKQEADADAEAGNNVGDKARDDDDDHDAEARASGSAASVDAKAEEKKTTEKTGEEKTAEGNTAGKPVPKKSGGTSGAKRKRSTVRDCLDFVAALATSPLDKVPETYGKKSVIMSLRDVRCLFSSLLFSALDFRFLTQWATND